MQKGDIRNRRARDLINWSEVARRLGLSPRYVVMLRRGQRKNEERLKQIERLISDELTSGNGQVTRRTEEEGGSGGKDMKAC
ncbi:MAG TPA: hypothetical protein PL001_13220, partial [Candidatus Kryptobacter bacterium]|nr:hypothetical protein [Candidatus Kryptobacter bacterium]